jgi:pimeloyl-ACP methyl ester carboxylesterase
MTNLHILDPNPKGFPAVLLLHGLGANCTSWSFQFEALQSAGLRPIAPDVSGFGKSKYNGRGWSFRHVADEIATLLSELNCGAVHVVGLSMGGVIAQQFALDHPNLVRKLVLVSTFSVLRPSGVSQWLYFFSRAVVVHTVGLHTQSKLVAKRVFPDPEQETLREIAETQIASADPRAYRAAMRSLGLFNSSNWINQINKPTLVITGSKDSTIAPLRQKILADGIPGARHIIIQGAGHAVPIDQAKVFNNVLVEFLVN